MAQSHHLLATLIQPINVERADVLDRPALFMISTDHVGLPLSVINVNAIMPLLAIIPASGFKYFSEKQSCFLDAGRAL